MSCYIITAYINTLTQKSGWAIAHKALIYPLSTAFSRVLAVTKRPLTKKEATLPEDNRLEIWSGVDLSQEAEEPGQTRRTLSLGSDNNDGKTLNCIRSLR